MILARFYHLGGYTWLMTSLMLFTGIISNAPYLREVHQDRSRFLKKTFGPRKSCHFFFDATYGKIHCM
jgi:hypothetical protein